MLHIRGTKDCVSLLTYPPRHFQDPLQLGIKKSTAPGDAVVASEEVKLALLLRMSDTAESPIKTLNFNIGVLGHVDSGKTSLARALSSTASTAAFDKNPQSRERGITLDLGFSSFTVDLPEHLRESGNQQRYDSLQFTLVDCPGHASLIRTIIGGNYCFEMCPFLSARVVLVKVRSGCTVLLGL